MIAEPDDILLGAATFATVRLGLITTVVAGNPGVAFDPIGGSVLRSAGLLWAGTRRALRLLGGGVHPVVARRGGRGGRNSPLWSFGALGPAVAVLRAPAAGLATFRPRLKCAHVLDRAGTALAALRLRLTGAAFLDWLRTWLDALHRLFACGSFDGINRPLGAFGRAP